MNIASQQLKYTNQRKASHGFLLIFGAALLVSGQALGCPKDSGCTQGFECGDRSYNFCVSPGRAHHPRRGRLQYDATRNDSVITPPTIVPTPAPTIAIHSSSSNCEISPDGTCGLPERPNRPKAGPQVPSFGFSCSGNTLGECAPIVVNGFTPREGNLAEVVRRQSESHSAPNQGYQPLRSAYPHTAGNHGERQISNQIERLKSIWEQHPDLQQPRNGRQLQRK